MILLQEMFKKHHQNLCFFIRGACFYHEKVRTLDYKGVRTGILCGFEFYRTAIKVKLKEGKRRNGFAIEFFFSPAKEMIVDNKGGMFIRDTLQRGNQSVTFINEERDVLKWNTLSQVEFSIGIQKNARCCR